MRFFSGLIETLQLIFHHASWDVIRESPGFGNLFIASAMVILPTILGLATGVLNWRETPLARQFGVPLEERDNKAWVERACKRARV